MTFDLAALSDGELYAHFGRIREEFHRRGLSDNGPGADLAEKLVAEWTGGTLAPPSTKGWDVLTPDGRRLQVKSRIVRDRKDAGQRQLSALRSWDFEELAVVLFNPDFTVWQAVTVTRDVVQTRARFSEHVNASRLMATAPLLALGAPIPGAPRRQDGSP